MLKKFSAKFCNLSTQKIIFNTKYFILLKIVKQPKKKC